MVVAILKICVSDGLYNFDLDLRWVMILRYTYDGVFSSGNELKVSE
jgi:hypothetical protein